MVVVQEEIRTIRGMMVVVEEEGVRGGLGELREASWVLGKGKRSQRRHWKGCSHRHDGVLEAMATWLQQEQSSLTERMRWPLHKATEQRLCSQVFLFEWRVTINTLEN